MFLNNVDSMTAGLVSDLRALAPELILSAGVVLLLVLRLFRGLNKLHMGLTSAAIVVVALGVAWTQWHSDPALLHSFEQKVVSEKNVERTVPLSPATAKSNLEDNRQEIFGRLVIYDTFTAFVRILLLGFVILVIWLTMLTGIPDQEDSADFYTLLLGATVGMMLMASANHLLMVFIAVEMASLPSYAMAGFLKGRRQSSEAALKYVVYGGAASGVMLYGISLLAGRFGTAYLPEVASSFIAVLDRSAHDATAGIDPVLITGMLLILVGIAFKLAAVPFHFWCPDVFEGAAAEVAGFLSVASKAAAIALLARFSLAFVGGVPGNAPLTDAQWKLISGYLGPALVFFAAITATFGNLAAYAQTNMKRLLAYSTIAHAGYMTMALATLTRDGAEAAMFYLIAYLFMNLGAFAVVAFIRNQIGSEDLSDYGGMIHRAPWLTVALAIFLLSLVGLPPLLGFAGKYQVFAALYSASKSQANNGLMVLLVIGLFNTVISLVYYVKVLKVMIIDPAPANTTNGDLKIPLFHNIYALVLAAVTTVGMLAWDPLSDGTRKAVQQFLPASTTITKSP